MKCFEFSEREVKLLVKELEQKKELLDKKSCPVLYEVYLELKEWIE